MDLNSVFTFDSIDLTRFASIVEVFRKAGIDLPYPLVATILNENFDCLTIEGDNPKQLWQAFLDSKQTSFSLDLQWPSRPRLSLTIDPSVKSFNITVELEPFVERPDLADEKLLEFWRLTTVVAKETGALRFRSGCELDYEQLNADAMPNENFDSFRIAVLEELPKHFRG